MSNIVNVTITKKHLGGPLEGLETEQTFYHDNRVSLGMRIGDRSLGMNKQGDFTGDDWEIVGIKISPRKEA